MSIKRELVKQIRGWFPQDCPIAFVHKMIKPWWWKPLWIVSALGIIISALIFSLFGLAPERILLGAVIAFLGLGAAYYIRVRHSLKINRAVYVCLGIGIGSIMWMIYALSGVGLLVVNLIGVYPALIINFVFYIVGALIGDWIGKKRNYQVPLYP
ncbi:MAG: hypothetical protein ACFCUE_07150 [Candidatus Bathyarchaeia archaeon]|jgi:hypothetical protein